MEEKDIVLVGKRHSVLLVELSRITRLQGLFAFVEVREFEKVVE